MPGFDGSGPKGAGPMTGGRRGECSSINTKYGRRFFGEKSYGMGYGRGFRGGSGPGMGMRRSFGGNFTETFPSNNSVLADELNVLKAEAELVKNVLDTITRRITELEKTV